MNILITGGDGFIADHLKRYLSNFHSVYAPKRTQLDCLSSEQVSNFFDQYSIDVVIHTALTGREELFSSNPQFLVDGLLMWKNLYNNRHKFKQLIQFGTAYELDLNKHNNLITASDILKDLPNTSYGYSKNLISRVCLETENFYNLRLFGNFHPSEKPFRFFKKLYTSTHFEISQNKFFDYVYLDDILTVVKFVIDEKPSLRDFNVVYKHKLSLSSQVEIFCSINKIDPTIIIKEEGFNLTGDSTILDSFNLKLTGLESGFEKYGTSL
jgi:UDP-glucose 4-epimerase